MTSDISQLYQDKLNANMSNENTLYLNLLDYRASLFFLLVNITCLGPMFYFCKLIRQMVRREQVKKEDTILSKVLQYYSALMPLSILFLILSVNVAMSFVYPVSLEFGACYCYGFQLLAHICVVYLGILSAITATIRYKFAKKHQVNTPKVRERQKTVFLVLHLVTPIIVSVLHFLIIGDNDDTFWVNHCWEHNDSEAQENEATILLQIAEKTCYNREFHVENYVSTTAANIIEPLLRVACGGIGIFYLVYMSNIVEIFMYLIIFKHVNR